MRNNEIETRRFLTPFFLFFPKTLTTDSFRMLLHPPPVSLSFSNRFSSLSLSFLWIPLKNDPRAGSPCRFSGMKYRLADYQGFRFLLMLNKSKKKCLHTWDFFGEFLFARYSHLEKRIGSFSYVFFHEKFRIRQSGPQSWKIRNFISGQTPVSCSFTVCTIGMKRKREMDGEVHRVSTVCESSRVPTEARGLSEY